MHPPVQMMSALSVFAYTNPGVAGYLIQMLAAGAFGAIFVIKHYWDRFRRTPTQPPADPSPKSK